VVIARAGEIGHRASVDVVIAGGLRGSVVLRVGHRVPAPVGHGVERDALFISLGEALQAGRISGEGEVAIAHGEGGEWVEFFGARIVAGDEGVAVDRIGGGGGEGGRGKQGAPERQESRGPGHSQSGDWERGRAAKGQPGEGAASRWGEWVALGSACVSQAGQRVLARTNLVPGGDGPKGCVRTGGAPAKVRSGGTPDPPRGDAWAPQNSARRRAG